MVLNDVVVSVFVVSVECVLMSFRWVGFVNYGWIDQSLCLGNQSNKVGMHSLERPLCHQLSAFHGADTADGNTSQSKSKYCGTSEQRCQEGIKGGSMGVGTRFRTRTVDI